MDKKWNNVKNNGSTVIEGAEIHLLRSAGRAEFLDGKEEESRILKPLKPQR
jgi:hypothetical protein